MFDLVSFKRKYINSFRSLTELYRTLLASTYLPFINWDLPPHIRGVNFAFDGAFAKLQPVLPKKKTIRVNPFSIYPCEICGNNSVLNSFSVFNEERINRIFEEGYIAAKNYFSSKRS